MRDTVVRKRKYRCAKLEIYRVALLRRTWHGIALDYGEKSGIRKYRIELSDKVLKWAATSPYSDWINFLRGILVRKFAFRVLMWLMIAMLVGCNTVSGFGKDVQKLGRKMEEAADRRNR